MDKCIKKAKEIIQIVKKKMMKEDPAVIELFELLKPVAVTNDVLLESDGNNLFFNPHNIMDYYNEHKLQELERRYLHILLHGILGHFTEREGYVYKDVIDMVYDFQVENIRKSFKTQKIPYLDNCRVMYEKIKNKMCKMSDEVVNKIHQDNHGLWELKNNLNMLEAIEELSVDETAKKWKEAVERLSFTNSSILSELCRNIEKSKGEKTYGNNAANIKIACKSNGKAVGNYYEVLKEYFFEKEANNEDINMIDKIMYSYGFENYGNIALVEPDEENEKKAINNIVIALDTSGSCYRYIERFLVETKEIFKKLSEGIGFEAIYILQADINITNEQRYTSAEEILTKLEDEYMTYGYGGTDFGPVFKRCSELVKEGKKIDCLIYFSDGEGFFPRSKPKEFDTFFVVPQVNGYQAIDCPEWIRKIYIQVERGELFE